ncbi:MAG TPA: glycosyltransferase [Candidatus Paceibacterota bacterium]|nr:glycosyltransferase [Candidatus Paceibacterota bacterium]
MKKGKSKLRNVLERFAGATFFITLIYLILIIKLTSGYHQMPGYGWILTFYSIAIGIYILSRFLLAYFHKPVSFDPYYEPTVSVVVPAKNEGENIAETIRCFFNSNYPKEKMEIIAINDGSDDNTYAEMLRAQKEGQAQGINVEVINWKVNKGKREGMAEGVKRAKNKIIVFVDSDSFVEKDCIRHLVKYFSNPKIGTVSGHTNVYNKNTNILTKMQSLRYYVSFKIYKAAESIFGVVTYCPGCCSAYRKAYLDPVLEEWRTQKFLGSVCTLGYDRSLTNFIIKKYDAINTAEAKAETVVPDNFQTYMRQQQRWKKSWVRETFIAAKFMWKKNPIAAISFYTYLFLAFAAPFVFFHAVIYYPLAISGQTPLPYLFGLFIMLVLHGVYYRNQTKRTDWLTSSIAFWVYTVLLIWQLPWALLTMKDSRLRTR